MKFLQTADLHIGKTVHGFSLLQDQKIVLDQITAIAKDEKIDAVLMAGDIYDRPVPSKEAVSVLDDFLNQLLENDKKVFIIAGNHDSPERLSFAQKQLRKNGLYICGIYDGTLERIKMSDEYGDIYISLLPFLKPPVIQYFYPEEKITTYEEALRTVFCHNPADTSKRNILMTHQFVTYNGISPERSDSEVISAGGTDNVDVSIFEEYDYVALGHIHGPQKIGRESVRYAGSILKYSFSETFHKKSVTIIESKAKDKLEIRKRLLNLPHDMRVIKGRLEELMKKETADAADKEDYIKAVLTDEVELINPIGSLRSVYPNIMELTFERNNSKDNTIVKGAGQVKQKSMIQLYTEFYEMVMEKELEENREKVLNDILKEIEGEEET